VCANSDQPVPEFPVSHPGWCNPKACHTYTDHDGKAAFVFHAAIFNGRANCIAALSQREVVDATGRTMELDEAYVTVRRNGVEELHLPAGQARIRGEEERGEVGAMILIALSVLNQAR
jgi:hypothetical protein